MLSDVICGIIVVGVIGLLVVLGEVICKLAIKYSETAEQFFDDLPDWGDED
ncbi:MAG: hypothetical protein IKT98_03845 [Selenomonadaceae bacterium]|nr:hypothetical protein [Selenomonadaceae bacterium]